jgi:hypothetical protein
MTVRQVYEIGLGGESENSLKLLVLSPSRITARRAGSERVQAIMATDAPVGILAP